LARNRHEQAPRNHQRETRNEIAPQLTGQGLPLRKCEAYDRPYDQPLRSD
jgi:hypothetical protein